MNRKISYKTKWQDEIINYFKEKTVGHVTASDVYEYFRGEGYTIGMTTVYRQLDNLVKAGHLNKYVIEVGSPACYEYNDLNRESDSNVCFHCKCEVCGVLIHLRCGELLGIRDHLAADHDFELDQTRTVFYGICSDCRNN